MDELTHDDEYLLGLADQETNASIVPPALRGRSDEVSYGQEGHTAETETGNWLDFVIIISILFAAALLTRAVVQIIYNSKDKIFGNKSSFHHAVSEAKRETTSGGTTSTSRTSTSSASSASVEPSPPPTVMYKSYDGDFYKSTVKEKGYRCRKHDSGKSRSGFVRIHLTNNSTNGYDIKGMCADADGCATITDGHVSYNGDAWWVQEILGDDEERQGLKVLSRGKFIQEDAGDEVAMLENQNNSSGRGRGRGWTSFDGSWVTNEGTHGRYSKFEANNVTAIMVDIPVAAVVPEPAISISH